MDDQISGGFYIKARKIQDSWIAHAPPHVREIWDFILRKANWKDHRLPRGCLITSYEEIREGLHWMVGWRKEKYSRWDCEKAMKALTKATMIATKKTTRGLIITVLNYDKYQNIENYESHNETYRKATRKPQTTDTIRKEREESKNEKNVSKDTLSGTNGTRPIPYQEIIDFLNTTCNTQFKASTGTTRNLIKARHNQGFSIEDFKAVITTKAEQWLTDPKMVTYLRPQTLFGTKFESYLSESTRKPIVKETLFQRKQREWEEKHGLTCSDQTTH